MIGIIIGLIFLLIVFTLIIAKYMSKRWEAEKELNSRREKTIAEESNVRYCLNKYRREVQRAKEILSIGLVALKNEKVEINAKDVENLITTSGHRNQNYNIYYLLGEVLATVNRSESDLLTRIERANSKVSDYNIYIRAPVFPRMIAEQLEFNEEEYDTKYLEQLDDLLNQRIAQTDLLDDNLNKLLPENTSKGKNEKEKNRKRKIETP